MITDARALFLHRLRQMLWIEETLARETLPRLREQAHANHLAWALDRHLLETEGHVRNLGRVFVAVGERAHALESVAFRGLEAEAEELLASAGDDRFLGDLALIDAVMHSEHLEVAGYEGLVHLAQALEAGVFQDVVYLLRTNLEQDAYALEELERALAKLLAEKIESVGSGTDRA
jgi:ferritin-like metal-binding protein YciE